VAEAGVRVPSLIPRDLPISCRVLGQFDEYFTPPLLADHAPKRDGDDGDSQAPADASGGEAPLGPWTPLSPQNERDALLLLENLLQVGNQQRGPTPDARIIVRCSFLT
jgi:hypothetical protein